VWFWQHFFLGESQQLKIKLSGDMEGKRQNLFKAENGCL
jgi:hypothetical protein